MARDTAVRSSFPEAAYDAHRQGQIADRLPVGAAVIFAVSLFYAVGEFIQRPAHFQEVLLPNCLQLAIPLAVWWSGRGRWRHHAEHVALVADLAFTATLVGQLFLPTNTTSGTALFIAVKMLATALLFPWSARLQYLSAGVTLLLYWGALSISGRASDSAALLHQLLGPLIAALLSAAGATAAERARRALFLRERQLEASEARFRALVENAFEAVSLLDRDGTLRYVSPSNRRWLGDDSTDGIGHNAFTDLHPDDLERGRAVFKTVLDNPGKPVTDQLRVRQRDGSWRWIEVTVSNLLDNPDVQAIVVNSRDITRRRAAEDALRRSERYFRSVTDNAQDLVAIIDPDGTMRYASPSFERALGYKPDEVIGKKGFDFIHPADLPAVTDTVARVIQSADSTISVEYRFRHRDGSWRTLESLGRNLLDDPAVGGVVVNSRDVTERRRAEAEVQRLNAALEQRVKERTAQLEAANKELEAFAYSVSHDLRAPLRAIQGFSAMLLEDHVGLLDAQGREYLDRVVGATTRMGQLIDDLLELSRVTRSEMRWQRVDLSALAQGIAADLQRTQPQRHAEFVIDPGLVAHGDVRLLRIALENLLGNAWKYTSKEPQARIEFGTCSVADSRWLMADSPIATVYFMRDNGAGFDMAYAGKLFGAFQRLHSATEFEGTGIGLATVQRIIHRHGGRIWAEGVVEEGATFYFTLERAPADAHR